MFLAFFPEYVFRLLKVQKSLVLHSISVIRKKHSDKIFVLYIYLIYFNCFAIDILTYLITHNFCLN